jgi:hypothetical protein
VRYVAESRSRPTLPTRARSRAKAAAGNALSWTLR